MSRPSDRDLETALGVVAYQWALHGDEFALSDPIHGIEALREAACAFPDGHVPLAEVYPQVARLAALSLQVLAALGEPGEVDGLHGFEGFDFWRESRPR